ncbi:ATP-dependent RNA helicase DeaD [Palleronia marisminoris]|uniref:ATP-dependent RNA helicase DeaD n=1 Tax=Palleronia marisminoris TaxID=315423 RepID=A0A1Y5SE55_9RHOB|nr:DEAD/DEAH box helicase [Palleronia marisminoris]SFG70387.1 ATP-dependent RNA helicase DeaD [Palleronia marisminoris]SLN35917.1 ATP-dependent RNA helicase DeaD [Palleronia marisminoris]
MIQTLLDALTERGYDTLTPVQEAVTDPALDEADLLVSAQTGSGKTVGFGLAIGPTLLDENGMFERAAAPLALIVAPTRELAFQVTRELDWLYAKAGARVVSCVGGMDMRDERRALDRGAHIVVGTPGRLKDHIQRNSLEMGSLRAVVLDEADEMLDLGFREDLEFMLGEAPASRRTLMFSATVPKAIATLAQRYQRDAVRVTTVSERSQHADITYQALRVAQQDAENAIINVLRFHDAQNAIVFANTRATVSRLTARFANRGFAVVSLSGELSQTERSHALQAMRDGRARVCVATDVAARGIDLPNLELVIHAELPSNAEGLLHRSGRTGRAGRKGTSALVVPPKAIKRAERLLQSARITAEWTTAPGAEEILRRDEDRLLNAPSWSEAITENEADFAERLLAMHDPRKVAAAYLRLYRTQHSAPEDLSEPDARSAPKERVPFGDSAWIALSVGRDDRAEARWILPLLCRSGNLDKDAIGAIRVQQTETFVELSAPLIDSFMAALGPDATLEKGVAVRRIDGPQESAPAPRPAPRAAPAPKPAERPAPKPPAKSAPAAPAPQAKPREASYAKKADRAPAAKPAPSKPSAGRAKPAWKKDDKPTGPAKRWEKPGDGPRKGAGGKHKTGPGSTSRPAASASDTSKRFTPPGGAKRAKPAGGSGSKPGGAPKRRKD